MEVSDKENQGGRRAEQRRCAATHFQDELAVKSMVRGLEKDKRSLNGSEEMDRELFGKRDLTRPQGRSDNRRLKALRASDRKRLQ